MSVIVFPKYVAPRKVTWGLVSNTETFTSPLNRTSQTVERPGARWKATWEFAPLSGEKLQMLDAFLTSLGGMAGRFRVWPHHRKSTVTASPKTRAVMTDFKVLPAQYFLPNAQVVSAGDFLEVNGELKMVVGDAYSDGNGRADIRVAPAFRAAPAVDSPINFETPMTTMMLTSDEYSIAVGPGRISEPLVFSGIEVF